MKLVSVEQSVARSNTYWHNSYSLTDISTATILLTDQLCSLQILSVGNYSHSALFNLDINRIITIQSSSLFIHITVWFGSSTKHDRNRLGRRPAPALRTYACPESGVITVDPSPACNLSPLRGAAECCSPKQIHTRTLSSHRPSLWWTVNTRHTVLGTIYHTTNIITHAQSTHAVLAVHTAISNMYIKQPAIKYIYLASFALWSIAQFSCCLLWNWSQIPSSVHKSG